MAKRGRQEQEGELIPDPTGTDARAPYLELVAGPVAASEPDPTGTMAASPFLRVVPVWTQADR